MTDLENIRLSCPFEKLSSSYREVIAQLPVDIALRLRDIFKSYFGRVGLEGVHERLNNRSVAQILREFQPGEAQTIASGEIDGVRYKLYDALPEKTATDEGLRWQS